MTIIATVGTAVQDLVFTVVTLPSGDGKTFAGSARVVGGGPAATAAATIAALGGEARFVGRVGDDAPGVWIRSDLERWNVDTSLLATVPGAQSAVSAVVIDAHGDRMIVNHTDDALFEAPAPPMTDRASAVLADLRWPAGAVAGLAEARERAIPGVLDFDLNTAGSLGLEALRLASHAVFARPALLELTGDEDVADALRKAATMTMASVAVTVGDAGSLVFEGGAIREIPAPSVRVVDTLGAGDVFHGAFALRIAEGASDADALTFASSAAALKCTKPGGREGIPQRSEVEELMKETM